MLRLFNINSYANSIGNRHSYRHSYTNINTITNTVIVITNIYIIINTVECRHSPTRIVIAEHVILHAKSLNCYCKVKRTKIFDSMPIRKPEKVFKAL